MEKQNIVFASKIVELSEYKTYLELVNRVCYYNYPNANDAELPYDDTTLEKAQTLIDMPVKAKYTVNAQGLPTFRGHEAYIDSDGDIAFDTDRIGVHVDVYIQEDAVEIGNEVKTLPCLFAKQKIWTENKNVVAAVKRLYSEGRLHNSWELIADEYIYSNGIRKITSYVFTGNCFLGYEYASPAFGDSAKVISLSSKNKEYELLIAESLSKDLIASQKNDSNINSKIKSTEQEENKNLNMEKEIAKIENVTVSNSETETLTTEEVKVDTVDTPVDDSVSESNETETETTSASELENSTESSVLTEWDLRDKIRDACKAKLGKWCWVAFHFPTIKTVWVEAEYRESEMDFVLFTYEVIGDVVTVSEPTDVKLTVTVSEINTTIEKLQSDLSVRDKTIITLNSKIQDLTSEITSLIPFKEEFEKAEQKRIEAETDAKKEILKNNVVKATKMSFKDVEASKEIMSMIDTLDETKLNSYIVSQIINKVEIETPTVEVSTAKESSVKRESLESNVPIDHKSIMKSFLAKS